MARILVVGTVRDVSGNFQRDIARIQKAFLDFDQISFFFVESDSSDNTLGLLKRLSVELTNFKYISLGQLSPNIASRIERIRISRNSYVSFIRQNLSDFDYVVVADMDGINSRLSRRSISKCFENLSWDAVFPNQPFGYFDILALRHKFLQPHDYMQELDWRKSLIDIPINVSNWSQRIRLMWQFDRARHDALYSKMLRISRKSKWIEVDSAFGGLGIYRIALFEHANYGEGGVLNECEHVHFHEELRRKGAKLYIVPSFVNSNVNTYNINKVFLIRQARRLLWNSKSYNFIAARTRGV